MAGRDWSRRAWTASRKRGAYCWRRPGRWRGAYGRLSTHVSRCGSGGIGIGRTSGRSPFSAVCCPRPNWDFCCWLSVCPCWRGPTTFTTSTTGGASTSCAACRIGGSSTGDVSFCPWRGCWRRGFYPLPWRVSLSSWNPITPFLCAVHSISLRMARSA